MFCYRTETALVDDEVAPLQMLVAAEDGALLADALEEVLEAAEEAALLLLLTEGFVLLHQTFELFVSVTHLSE